MDSASNRDDQAVVSAVIPTYERPDFVREAVQSVLAQTYDPIELVVVDDHSEAPARSALQGLSLDALAAVKHVRHPENRGASAARNTGIDVTSGEYVAFLDDDDRWHEEKIEKQVQQFRQTEETVGLVSSGIEYSTGEKSTVDIPRLSGNVTYDLLVGRSLAPTSTVMVRRGVLERVDGFDEALPSWNDRDFYLRLSNYCQFDVVPEPLTVRRAAHGADQISRDYRTKREITYPRFVSKHRPTAARYGWRCERRFLASVSAMLAHSAMTNGHYGEARRHFLRSIRWNPFDRDPYVHLLVVLGGWYTYKPAELTHGLLAKVKQVFRRTADI